MYYIAKWTVNSKDRKQKKRYIKPLSVKDLENKIFERKKLRYPNNPYIPITKFRDDTANGLTKCVCAWLQVNGYFAARINTTGNYNAHLEKWVYSGSKKGMADVTSVINGRHVSIEIKIKDKPLPDQLKVKQEIESAGGLYIFVRSFDDFLKQIQNIN